MKIRPTWRLATVLVPLFMIAASIRGNAIVAGWDLDLSGLRPGLAIERAYNLWAGYANLGYDGGLGLSNLWPSYTVMGLLHSIALPYVVVQWVLYAGILVATCQAMFALSKRLFPSSTERVWALIALSYILNFYALVTWYTPLLFVISAYLFAPLLAVVIFDFVNLSSRRSAIIALTAFILSSAAAANLAYWLMMLVVAVSGGVFAIGFASDRRTASFRFVAAVAAFIGIQTWWLLPALHTSIAHLHELVATTYSLKHNDGALIATSDASSLSRSVRMIGTWDFFNSDRFGAFYLTFAKVFQPGTIAGILTFIFPWLLVRSLSRPHPRMLSWFALWLLVAVFLMKGIAEPFSGLFWDLYKHVPGGAMFRTPYTKFGLLAAPAFAILIGHGLDQALRNSKRETLAVASLVLVLMATISAYTLFRLNAHQPSYYVHIPPTYIRAAEYASSVGTERILSLPSSEQISFSAYQWGYNGTDPYYRLLSRDTILERNNWTNLYADRALKLIDLLPNMSGEQIKDTLDYFDVDTIIIHHDILWDFYHTKPADNVERALRKFCDIRNFSDTAAGVDIDVLHRRDSIPSRVTVSKGLARRTAANAAILLSFAKRSAEPIAASRIVTQFIRNDDVLSPGTVPRYNLSRVAPGHYIMSVNSDRYPFYVSLKEAFDGDWRARYMTNGVWHDDAEHFVSNGYQNGWYVPGSNVTRIDLYYAGQRIIVPAFLGSGVTVVVVLCGVLFLRRRMSPLISCAPDVEIIEPDIKEELVVKMGLVSTLAASLLDFFQLQADADIATVVILLCIATLSVRHLRRPREQRASATS